MIGPAATTFFEAAEKDVTQKEVYGFTVPGNYYKCTFRLVTVLC